MVAAAPAHEVGVLQLLGRQAGCLDLRLGGLVRLLAFGADDADQPLSHDGNDGGSDKERLNTNIDQARYSAGRVVRVECAKYQVSCQRRLDGDLSGFVVADFADEDDV